MGLVLYRRLAVPLWAIVFFTVALSAPPPTTLFLIPPSTLLAIALLGIAVIIFTAPGLVRRLRTSPAIVRSAPSRRAHKTAVAVLVCSAAQTNTNQRVTL